MFDRIKALIFGTKSIRRDERRKMGSIVRKKVKKYLKAHYDSASTSAENRRHWREARENTATSINNRETRRKLRIRGRYEHDNNCYCSGMVSTLSKDVVGYNAPTLQVLTEDTEFNSLVEQEWKRWSNDPTVNLTAKWRLLDSTKRVEGEAFQFIKTDAQTEINTGYSINIEIIGPQRITDPSAYIGYIDLTSNTYNDDGVIVDRSSGRPVAFIVQPTHYYGNVYNLIESNHIRISSRYIQQWYSPTRTEQYRGVCEIQQALGLFAQLRRYSIATLVAAEVAANLAGVMKTTQVPSDGPMQVKEYSEIPLVRGSLVSLPDGWDAQQFEPKQPISGYSDFVNTQLREIGRLLDIPRGVMLGDSSMYNYSSARLDFQNYDDRITFDRGQLNLRIADPLFAEWFLEFLLVNVDNPIVQRYLKLVNGDRLPPKHNWQYTKRPSIDPQKDADAATARMKNLTSNLAMECALNGDDWEEVLNGWKNILVKVSELGLTDKLITDIINSVSGQVPSTPPTNNGQNVKPQPSMNGSH